MCFGTLGRIWHSWRISLGSAAWSLCSPTVQRRIVVWSFCKHCKVVYFVDEEADTLVIADVWDTRREPKNLMQNL